MRPPFTSLGWGLPGDQHRLHVCWDAHLDSGANVSRVMEVGEGAWGDRTSVFKAKQLRRALGLSLSDQDSEVRRFSQPKKDMWIVRAWLPCDPRTSAQRSANPGPSLSHQRERKAKNARQKSTRATRRRSISSFLVDMAADASSAAIVGKEMLGNKDFPFSNSWEWASGIQLSISSSFKLRKLFFTTKSPTADRAIKNTRWLKSRSTI